MYTIITDSCGDMNPRMTENAKQFHMLPLTYIISGDSRAEIMDDAAAHGFYERLRAGEVSTTSQISPGDYYDLMKECAKAGEDMLVIAFSSGLSGTYNSACQAKEMVLDDYPKAVIEVVDSLAASAGQGLMIYDALQNRDNGMSLEDNAAFLREHCQNYIHWFTVDDLNFLKRGGRCSPSAAFFGTLVKIKPVLCVNPEGKLVARMKVRGRKQALQALVAKFKEHEAESDQVIFISHGDCEEDAQFVKDELVRECSCTPDKIILSFISPVIGSHAGPGTVALFFRANKVRT